MLMNGKGIWRDVRAAAPGDDDEAVLDVRHRLLDSEQPLHHRSTPAPSAAAITVPPVATAATAVFPLQRHIRLRRRPADSRDSNPRQHYPDHASPTAQYVRLRLTHSTYPRHSYPPARQVQPPIRRRPPRPRWRGRPGRIGAHPRRPALQDPVVPPRLAPRVVAGPPARGPAPAPAPRRAVTAAVNRQRSSGQS
jgi:hypothetical protein